MVKGGGKKTKKSWETIKVKPKVAPEERVKAGASIVQKSAVHGKAGAATSDQGYFNKMYMGLDKSETTNAPKLDEGEIEKLSAAAKEKHLFLHEKAVAAYHEQKERDKHKKFAFMYKEDKYGEMTVAEIIKEDPIAINAFRPNKTFQNANGLGVYSVKWNSKGDMLATAGHDRSLTLWRPTAVDGLPARKLKGHKGWTLQATFSPDDKLLATCSSDEVYIWNPSNGTLMAEWEAHDAMINGCVWSNTGKYILSVSNDMTGKIWLSKQALKKGKQSIGGGGHHHVEEEDDEHHHDKGVPVEFQLPREGERGHSSAVIKGAFSHDDSWCITCGKDKLLIMWNLKIKGSKERVYRGHEEAVLNVSVNFDSTRIASCDNSGKVIVWDPKVEAPVHVLDEHTDITYCVVFGRESKEGKGRLITAGHDQKICVWDVYKGTLIGQLQSKHSSWITGMDIDGTNMRLATCSMDARSSLVLWQSLPPAPKTYEWLEVLFRKWAKVKRMLNL